MIQPGPGRADQVNGEEVDDEKVIISPAHPAHEAVVLQPRVSFAVVLDDIARRSKMLWETSIPHGAFESFWPKLLKAEVVSFTIIMASEEWVPRAALGLHVVVP
jgi:hypothetical protein